ncbi:hypothetical protein Vafri_11229, partial [Volvox africanus]
TLAGYYNTCSYGKVSLELSRVVILENLTIPCTGELKDLPFTLPSGNQFDTSGCGVDNMVKWHYYLDSIASEQHVVPTDFNHKVILLPEGFTATKPKYNSFVGSASVGPWMRNVSGTNSYGTHGPYLVVRRDDQRFGRHVPRSGSQPGYGPRQYPWRMRRF